VDTLQTAPFPPAASTGAHTRARLNWTSNLAALDQAQPRVAALARGAGDDGAQLLEWVFGRDGGLTARGADGCWWGDCSLPLRAARAMLKTLGPRGTVGCFLAPRLAAHVRVALEASESNQAVLLVQPDLASLRVLLQSEDFSRDIAGHRLWFACGEDWAGEMRRLFDERSGLPTPTQFIRLPGAGAELIDRLIQGSQTVFGQVIAARAAEIRRRCAEWRPRGRSPRRVCVVAGTRFQLWDDAGLVLRELTSGMAGADVEWRILNPDDPASASPARLAEMACDCDGLITANSSRADAPELVPLELPWLTWVTTPDRVPSPAAAGPNDGLLVVDQACRDLAVSRGWLSGRVEVAGWPPLLAGKIADESGRPTNAADDVALIADTMSIEPPARLDDFSSHAMLWETIRREIAEHPEAVGTDAGQFLERQIRTYGVAEEGLDRSLFIERLIRPAFAHAIARTLIGAGVTLRLFGEGWLRLDEFAAHAVGPIRSREELTHVVATSRVLLHCWPERHSHPIEAAGRATVRAAGKLPRLLMSELREALQWGASGGCGKRVLTQEALLRSLAGSASRTAAVAA
jgi:hypothetical protein